MFSPWNTTFPIEGYKLPAIKLNKVVLPDPFGPIIPVIEPFLIVKEQLETAANPPKFFHKWSTCKILFVLVCIK